MRFEKAMPLEPTIVGTECATDVVAGAIAVGMARAALAARGTRAGSRPPHSGLRIARGGTNPGTQQRGLLPNLRVGAEALRRVG